MTVSASDFYTTPFFPTLSSFMRALRTSSQVNLAALAETLLHLGLSHALKSLRMPTPAGENSISHAITNHPLTVTCYITSLLSACASIKRHLKLAGIS